MPNKLSKIIDRLHTMMESKVKRIPDKEKDPIAYEEWMTKKAEFRVRQCLGSDSDSDSGQLKSPQTNCGTNCGKRFELRSYLNRDSKCDRDIVIET